MSETGAAICELQDPNNDYSNQTGAIHGLLISGNFRRLCQSTSPVCKRMSEWWVSERVSEWVKEWVREDSSNLKYCKKLKIYNF